MPDTNASAASPTARLLDLLDIERLELDLFRGESPDERAGQRVFGGQVIAQSLVAAFRTVPDDRPCHSLHAYFIRPGDPAVPIIYQVDHSRDGGSFTTRRIVAIQHGKQILNMAASFHAPEEAWSHQQDEMPDVEGPEGLENTQERRAAQAELVPERFRDSFLAPRPIDVRDVDPLPLRDPPPASSVHHAWMRVAEPVDQPGWMHQVLLAYASDMSLLGSGNRPHGINWWDRELMQASLDHAIWFHDPAPAFDSWHLYAMDSPWGGRGRSFNRGEVYSETGRLVASVAQEGLMRRRKSGG